MTQKRKYTRALFSAASFMEIEGEAERISANVLDISFKGALIETPENRSIEPGTRISLQIQLEHSDVLIEMKTEAVHQIDGRTGLICLSIDLDSVTHLRRLLELNLGDSALVERELSQLG